MSDNASRGRRSGPKRACCSVVRRYEAAERYSSMDVEAVRLRQELIRPDDQFTMHKARIARVHDLRNGARPTG